MVVLDVPKLAHVVDHQRAADDIREAGIGVVRIRQVKHFTAGDGKIARPGDKTRVSVPIADIAKLLC